MIIDGGKATELEEKSIIAVLDQELVNVSVEDTIASKGFWPAAEYPATEYAAPQSISLILVQKPAFFRTSINF
jgi:hypothetical protein